MSASSITPRPPGVNGSAVSRRAKANAASTSTHPTCASDTPTNRRETSSTTYREMWLITVASVMPSQRARSSAMVR
jgi:hypothetical protein